MNKYHPYKAAAIDLDGTLLGHDLSISRENRAAINDLHQNGVEIILASGRHQISMKPFAERLGGDLVKWMVSAQGSFAANLDLSTILYDSHMETAKAEYVIDLSIRHNYPVIIYSKSGIFSLAKNKWVEYYTKLAEVEPTITTKEEILKESIFKVVLLNSEEMIDAALDFPDVQAWDLYRVRSLKNILEFAGNGTSKAHGLRPLLKHLNIDASELVSFGDAPNDNPMFELAGCGIAMSTAWPEAKAAANLVAPDGPQETSFARAVAMIKNA